LGCPKKKISERGIRMTSLKFLTIIVVVVALPAFMFGAGPHDSLSCTGCHGIHTAKTGELIFAVEPNKKAINPATKQPYSGTTALCLGCHATDADGGMGIDPVSPSHSHPFGIVPNPKRASVPDEALRDNKLECVGCHDPHPSNANYKYLRVDTAGGAKMENFCAYCHSAQAGSSAKK
jgi:predicted CXXCH cytochrome family protein